MRAKPASRVRIPPSPPTRCETPAAQVAGVFAFRAGMLGPMWPTVGRMYTPKHFDLPDLSHARLMIQEHPLATLMLIDPTHGLSATPVPMIWGAPSEASSSATGQASTGEGGWLEGHLARANPHVAGVRRAGPGVDRRGLVARGPPRAREPACGGADVRRDRRGAGAVQRAWRVHLAQPLRHAAVGADLELPD